ncbi:hypothetical protein ACJX0J_020744, partial [Zea mays]
ENLGMANTPVFFYLGAFQRKLDGMDRVLDAFMHHALRAVFSPIKSDATAVGLWIRAKKVAKTGDYYGFIIFLVEFMCIRTLTFLYTACNILSNNIFEQLMMTGLEKVLCTILYKNSTPSCDRDGLTIDKTVQRQLKKEEHWRRLLIRIMVTVRFLGNENFLGLNICVQLKL